jgi:hypothetical protein
MTVRDGAVMGVETVAEVARVVDQTVYAYIWLSFPSSI